MKKKISISINRDTDATVEEVVLKGRFRNKSHFIEFAVAKLLDEIKLNDEDNTVAEDLVSALKYFQKEYK